MAAKFVFLAGLLGIGGYMGHRVMTHDPAVYPYSKEQVETMLLEGTSTFARRGSQNTQEIRGVERTDNGVLLAMRSSSGGSGSECMAVVTSVSASESRVVVDCGEAATGSAIAATTAALRAPNYEEHVAATLGKRDFLVENVDAKQQAIVMKNMGGMQREALKTADEMQRFQAENEK